MTFASLLVHVEADPTSDSRLALAADLANQFDARLIGIGVEYYRPVYIGADIGVGDLIAAETASVQADLKHAEEKFRKVAAEVRGGSSWRAAVQFPITGIATEARAADLVVISSRAGASEYRAARPGALILQAGRPVLVTPPNAERLGASNIVVAWKDTREARRAVFDALPFLKRAKNVLLVEICNGADASPAATARLADVTEHLLRHEVTATFKAEVDETEVTASHHLLDIAERHSADLIVAGAYGHSRFQEWVFGGFTQALLSQTTRAVFFSH